MLIYYYNFVIDGTANICLNGLAINKSLNDTGDISPT